MRFVADESIEATVVERLRAHGHEVLSITETRPGTVDSAVLRIAAREHRVLVTNDKDFAALAFLQRRASGGIVLLRMPRWRSRRKAARLAEVIQAEGPSLAKMMTVVEAVRSRPAFRPGRFGAAFGAPLENGAACRFAARRAASSSSRSRPRSRSSRSRSISRRSRSSRRRSRSRAISAFSRRSRSISRCCSRTRACSRSAAPLHHPTLP
jgi:predicted nuclease of predicted toxin-antitoxin system